MLTLVFSAGVLCHDHLWWRVTGVTILVDNRRLANAPVSFNRAQSAALLVDREASHGAYIFNTNSVQIPGGRWLLETRWLIITRNAPVLGVSLNSPKIDGSRASNLKFKGNEFTFYEPEGRLMKLTVPGDKLL